MKNVMMALIMVLAITSLANAQSPQQGAPMSPGMTKEMSGMPMMPCMAMMKQSMGQDMVLYEMMQMMKEIITIQERLMEGATGRERKRVLSELSRLEVKVDKMMTDLSDKMKGMVRIPAAPAAGGHQEPIQAGPEQSPVQQSPQHH